MAETGHRGGARDFDVARAERYAAFRHGRDGRVLLDPQLEQFIRKYAKLGTCWADPGGGSGWISAMIAAGGGRVYYSDYNPALVQQARDTIALAGQTSLVDIQQADIRNLPYDDGIVDFVVCSNVGCAVKDLVPMTQQMARILRTGGELFMTAPASLSHVFCTDTDEDSAVEAFEAELRNVSRLDKLRTLVLGQRTFHRATLQLDGTGARLIRVRSLSDGDEILRIISGPMLVPNFWHDHGDYMAAIQQAGLLCDEVNDVTAHVMSSAQRAEVNAGQLPEHTLGSRYETAPAFRVYRARKGN